MSDYGVSKKVESNKKPIKASYRKLREWQPDSGDKFIRPRGKTDVFRPISDEEIERAKQCTFLVFREWLGTMPILDRYTKSNAGIRRVD